LARLKRIIISGYYGYSNTGDEAVLSSIVTGLREQAAGDPEIAVLSASPDKTASAYGVRALSRMSFPQVSAALRGCDLFISGGGSLIQDATSFKSLVYYLSVIALAQSCGCRVMLLGQGIGPLRRGASRILARRVLDRTHLITVRDPGSAELLGELGVRRPRIEVTADPTFQLRPCPPEEALGILSGAGIPSGEDVVAVALREWPEALWIEAAASEALADLTKQLPAHLLLVPMQMPGDLVLAGRIRQASSDGISVLPPECTPAQVMGVLAACRLVVGMRLHALIFAASAGVPALGIAYDPKVEHFLAATGQEGTALDDVASGGLADRVMSAWNHRGASAARLSERVPKMREAAGRNIRLALDLLENTR